MRTKRLVARTLMLPVFIVAVLSILATAQGISFVAPQASSVYQVGGNRDGYHTPDALCYHTRGLAHTWKCESPKRDILVVLQMATESDRRLAFGFRLDGEYVNMHPTSPIEDNVRRHGLQVGDGATTTSSDIHADIGSDSEASSLQLQERGVLSNVTVGDHVLDLLTSGDGANSEPIVVASVSFSVKEFQPFASAAAGVSLSTFQAVSGSSLGATGAENIDKVTDVIGTDTDMHSAHHARFESDGDAVTLLRRPDVKHTVVVRTGAGESARARVREVVDTWERLRFPARYRVFVDDDDAYRSVRETLAWKQTLAAMEQSKRTNSTRRFESESLITDHITVTVKSPKPQHQPRDSTQSQGTQLLNAPSWSQFVASLSAGVVGDDYPTEYVFLVDANVDIASTYFNPQRFLWACRAHGLHIAQPALVPVADESGSSRNAAVPRTAWRREGRLLRFTSLLSPAPLLAVSAKAWACIHGNVANTATASKGRSGLNALLRLASNSSQTPHACAALCDAKCGLCDACGIVDDTPIAIRRRAPLLRGEGVESGDDSAAAPSPGVAMAAAAMSPTWSEIPIETDNIVIVGRARWMGICQSPNDWSNMATVDKVVDVNPTAVEMTVGGDDGYTVFASWPHIDSSEPKQLSVKSTMANTDGDNWSLIKDSESELQVFEKASVVVHGASSGLYVVQALIAGAKHVTAVDMDSERLEVLDAVTTRIRTSRKVDVVHSKVGALAVNNGDSPAPRIHGLDGRLPQVALALGIVHWMFSCTEDSLSLYGTVAKLANTCTRTLLVEWVEPSDDIARNLEIVYGGRGPYSQGTFESALESHFDCHHVMGSTSSTRVLYAAYKADGSDEQTSRIAACKAGRFTKAVTPFPFPAISAEWMSVKDPVPIFILSRNRYQLLKYQIQNFKERLGSPYEIIIHDNNSTYPPLLRYLDQLKSEGVRVYRSRINKLEMIRSTIADYYFASGSHSHYYCVTDPDVVWPDTTPPDVLEFYATLLDRYRQTDYHTEAVAPLFRVDDVPEHYPLKHLWMWTDSCQHQKPNYEMYKGRPVQITHCAVDTTFAMYHASSTFRRMVPAIRTYAPYISTHLDWYIDPDDLHHKMPANCLHKEPLALPSARNTLYYMVGDRTRSWIMKKMAHYSGSWLLDRLRWPSRAAPWIISTSHLSPNNSSGPAGTGVGTPVGIYGRFPTPEGFFPNHPLGHENWLGGTVDPRYMSLSQLAYDSGPIGTAQCGIALPGGSVRYVPISFANATLVVCIIPPVEEPAMLSVWLAHNEIESPPLQRSVYVMAKPQQESAHLLAATSFSSTSELDSVASSNVHAQGVSVYIGLMDDSATPIATNVNRDADNSAGAGAPVGTHTPPCGSNDICLQPFWPGTTVAAAGYVLWEWEMLLSFLPDSTLGNVTVSSEAIVLAAMESEQTDSHIIDGLVLDARRALQEGGTLTLAAIDLEGHDSESFERSLRHAGFDNVVITSAHMGSIVSGVKRTVEPVPPKETEFALALEMSTPTPIQHKPSGVSISIQYGLCELALSRDTGECKRNKALDFSRGLYFHFLVSSPMPEHPDGHATVFWEFFEKLDGIYTIQSFFEPGLYNITMRAYDWRDGDGKGGKWLARKELMFNVV